jgi:ketosteroid isomerase-like protein
MKTIFQLFLLISSCSFAQTNQEKISTFIDNWHLAASNAKFDDYMNAMTDDAIYIGTDATENWNKKDFMAFAKPYFDRGKAWSFTKLQRNIFVSKDAKTAWFDELLNTQMKICRGSGVLVKQGKIWKIQHYVLSMTVPNENSSDVISAKKKIEDELIIKLKSN